MNRPTPDWIQHNQIEDLKRELNRIRCERDLLRELNNTYRKRIRELEGADAENTST